MDIHNVIQEYSSDISAVRKYCNELYDMFFSEHFEEVKTLYKRLKSTVRPISDSELEYILTMFPMELIIVAEKLNKIRLDREVIKLKNKEKLEQLRKKYTEQLKDFEGSKADKQNMLNHLLNENSVEYELALTTYDSVITRVENEQSFSRELIMGAKKIWDSRRSSENANPINPGVPELPEYHQQKYIK